MTLYLATAAAFLLVCCTAGPATAFGCVVLCLMLALLR